MSVYNFFKLLYSNFIDIDSKNDLFNLIIILNRNTYVYLRIKKRRFFLFQAHIYISLVHFISL
jgi:hypothetical protein